MNNINSVAIILARGGSKGIKNKNLQAINNKSLLEITVNQLRKKLKIDIFVSSDSKEILEKGEKNYFSRLFCPFWPNMIKKVLGWYSHEITC